MLAKVRSISVEGYEQGRPTNAGSNSAHAKGEILSLDLDIYATEKKKKKKKEREARGVTYISYIYILVKSAPTSGCGEQKWNFLVELKQLFQISNGARISVIYGKD